MFSGSTNIPNKTKHHNSSFKSFFSLTIWKSFFLIDILCHGFTRNNIQQLKFFPLTLTHSYFSGQEAGALVEPRYLPLWLSSLSDFFFMFFRKQSCLSECLIGSLLLLHTCSINTFGNNLVLNLFFYNNAIVILAVHSLVSTISSFL